jgi:hypothetical protein
MEVDPEILNRLATAAQDVSEKLRTLDAFGPFWTAQCALPGTDLQVVCADTARYTSTALLGMSQRMNVIAESAHGASKDYRVTEEELASRMRAMQVLE